MIPALIEKAVGVGLLPRIAHWDFNAHIRWNRILVDLFGENDERFHLRVAETYRIADEFETARSAFASLGRSVPEPLGVITVDGVEAIVFEAVRGRFVPAGELLHAPGDGREVASLLALLGSMSRKFRVTDASDDVGRWAAAIEARFIEADEAALVRTVLKNSGPVGLASTRSYWQHGDLVVDNLVFRADGVVLFDWEDFRKVSLAGFDLTTLLVSVAGFDAQCLQAIRSGGRAGGRSRLACWLPDACRAVGLATDDFWELVPFHLCVFLALKDRYSQSIRRRVLAVVQGLV